jgi:hypothetical protein
MIKMARERKSDEELSEIINPYLARLHIPNIRPNQLNALQIIYQCIDYTFK